MTELECISAGEIEEGDWVAYLHGDASPGVAQHITRCAFCAEQVERLRMVDAQLLSAFYREDCPTPEILADFTLNRLAAADKLRVAAHVRGCAACSEEVEDVRDLADEEPPVLLARLRESLALALVARPVVPAAAPARGVGWQGRFEVEDFIVTLSVQAGGVTGRVRLRKAGPDVEYSGQAWLLIEGEVATDETSSSEIDSRGRFRLALPPPGLYSLLLQIGEQNVALEKIRIE